MSTLTQDGTDGRVYGGDCNLIHIADGTRNAMGQEVAGFLDSRMRQDAVADSVRTEEQAYGEDAQKLCPGCYMVAIFDAAVTLAHENGQSFAELSASLAQAFARLKEANDYQAATIEEIRVALDGA